MLVGNRNHLIDRSFLQDRVRVQYEDVRSTASPNSHIVCPRKRGKFLPFSISWNARIIRAYGIFSMRDPSVDPLSETIISKSLVCVVA